MLRYCAWCNEYLGAIEGPGHQIRPDQSEIDTITICPACRERLFAPAPDEDEPCCEP